MVGSKPDSTCFIFCNGLDGIIVQQSRCVDVGTDDADLVSVVTAQSVDRAIPHHAFAVLKIRCMALTGSWGREGTGVIRMLDMARKETPIRLKTSKNKFFSWDFSGH